MQFGVLPHSPLTGCFIEIIILGLAEHVNHINRASATIIGSATRHAARFDPSDVAPNDPTIFRQLAI
jgi:hypothetical protein